MNSYLRFFSLLLVVVVFFSGTAFAQERGESNPMIAPFGAAVERTPFGVAIQSVTPNTPAAEAGLQSGDVIVAVNDQPLVFKPLTVFMRETMNQDRLELTVFREGEPHTINVHLRSSLFDIVDRLPTMSKDPHTNEWWGRFERLWWLN